MSVQRCLDCDRLVERVPNDRLCSKCLRTDIRTVPSLGASVRYPPGVYFDDKGDPDRTPVSSADRDGWQKPDRNRWVDTMSVEDSRCDAPKGKKPQAAAPVVRAVLVARLHHNHGDTLYVRAKSIARETGYNSATVTAALATLTGQESETAVDEWPLRIDTDTSTTQQRWIVRFVPRIERLGRVDRPGELDEYAPVGIAFEYVRRALHAALDRNYGDRIYGKARRFEKESVFETPIVGESLRAIETGDRDGQGVTVETRDDPRRRKYIVSLESGGGSS